MNGKGMSPRKGYNQKLYADNFDRIFRHANRTNQDTRTTESAGRPEKSELLAQSIAVDRKHFRGLSGPTRRTT